MNVHYKPISIEFDGKHILKSSLLSLLGLKKKETNLSTQI